jgi:nitroreductase
MIKRIITRVLPAGVANNIRKQLSFIRALPHYLYDLRRYSRYSINKVIPLDSQTQLSAKIITLYHVIEKGLSMPSPRYGFGEDRIKLLMKLLLAYKQKKYSCNTHFSSAVTVLENYVEFHKKSSIDVNYIEKFLSTIEFNSKVDGGAKKVSKNDVNVLSKGNFEDLVQARHSYRNFSDEKVDVDNIIDAIKIAQKSPSTCNRQSTRVYVIADRNKINQILQLQSGANGFMDKIDKLIMLTFDIESYQGEGDRSSGYIDTSLFGMTLIYALLYKGIGSISLNWSKPKNDDICLRKIMKIKESHNVVFFIGVGILKEESMVAVSSRFNVNEIVTKVN